MIGTPAEIMKQIQELVGEESCQTCGGTREVSTMEAVYPGEPHMADVGTEACPDCSGRDTEDDYNPDREI